MDFNRMIKQQKLICTCTAYIHKLHYKQATHLSLVLLKICVSDTLLPVDGCPSMVVIVDICPATYRAQPSHSMWSPCE